LERLLEVVVGLDTDEVPRVDVPDRRDLGVCGLRDLLVVMSRSVIIPTSCSPSVIGSEPMCSSRINRAASTTVAVAPIERGSSVIASRTLFAIMRASSPLEVRS